MNRRNRVGRVERRDLPAWLPYVSLIVVAILLSLAINFRAFSELRTEKKEYEELTMQAQTLEQENLRLQDDIHSLKNDPKAIEREAQKLGLGRQK